MASEDARSTIGDRTQGSARADAPAVASPPVAAPDPAPPDATGAAATPPRGATGAAASKPPRGAIEAIGLWKRRLLDLSKRNRALHFRPTRVSTVAVVDEVPGEVFRTLWMRRGKMGFRPAPERPPRASSELPVESGAPAATAPADAPAAEPLAPDGPATSVRADTSAGPVEWAETAAADAADAAEFEAGRDFAPYDPAALPERHTDALLQTAHAEEHLDRALLRLADSARSALEEQGVNTLFLALGMLEYRPAAEDGAARRAPVVLLPVTLERTSARAGYRVRATDEDPIVNPALAEYLRASDGIALPALPAEGLAEDFELQGFLRQVAEAIGAKDGWSLKDEVWLSIFSFQKFVMYKDLDAHGERFAAHRNVRQLVERRVDRLAGLPDDVRALELDRDFPPERGAQVVDADASQLRAIAAVARGHDLVLQGPPGTGKSQTITNLIADALSRGKSVLFVAEKLAALQVVHARLSRVGLGEFCLELHSTKANKRAVLEGLKHALDASLEGVDAAGGARAALPAARETLNAYAAAVHRPFGRLGRSPFEVYGEHGELGDAPRIALQHDPSAAGAAELAAATGAIRELERTLEDVGDPRRHPWREAEKDYYAPGELAEIGAACRASAAALAELLAAAAALGPEHGLPAARSWADFERVRDAVDVLERSPGAPLPVLEAGAWSAPPAAAEPALGALDRCLELRRRVLERFQESVLSTDHAADVEHVERRSSGLFSALAFLDARYRAIRRRWIAYRRPGRAFSMAEQAAEMRGVQEYAAARRALEGLGPTAAGLFGELWRGEASDPRALRAYLDWVVALHRERDRCPLARRALELASRPRPELGALRELLEQAARGRAAWLDLCRRIGWPEEYLAAAPLDELRARATEVAGALAHGPAWAAHAGARSRARATLAAPAVRLAADGRLPFDQLERAFLRAFHERFLEAALAERAELRQFHGLAHEQRVASFQELDRRVLEENQRALIASLRDQVQTRLRTPEAEAGKAFLLREMNRQRAHAPLRRTMQQAEATIRAIKPCFLMSPLTAAQLLRADDASFDLVVFDEASQLPSEDAIGSIARGRQLVVVGDPKQLPPTDFFRVVADGSDVPEGEDGQPLVQDTESVLEEFASSGAPGTSLRWHYRSAHESLIEFSNANFYGGELCTFPGVERARDHGLEFVHVADGVYEGAGHNPREVQAVVDAIVRHAREAPGLSLGVGTFNLRQQLAIQDELERRRREDPSLEPLFAPREQEGFFVKNLENIQGDERDAIFLSVTYGKSRDGRLRCNFGPLNGQNGWRRLNVLATRARRRMVVFASIRGDDIPTAAAATPGPRLLKEFLSYAEHGTLAAAPAPTRAAAASAFERDVERELTARGVQLEPQVGVSGYRVDFGVVDPGLPGRYLCGLECDGVAYHASPTARDRDRLRQQVLEARGWTIHRIWSTDWFKDRAGQIERILRRIEECRSRELSAAPPPAPPPAPAAGAGSIGEVSAASAASAPSPLPPPPAVSAPAPAPPDADDADSGPVLVPYRVCGARAAGVDLLDAPGKRVVSVLQAVIRDEAPIHVDELLQRAAAAFGKHRLGPRIQARLEQELSALVQRGEARLRDAFVWSRSDAVVPRDRSGMRIPGERVAPEEYREALRAVLERDGARPRDELVRAVTGALGLGRTQAARERAEAALASAIEAGEIGQGSAGFVLRAR